MAGAVTLDKLAANSVNASKIVSGSITAAQLAANTITGDKIKAGTIAAGNLAANSVTSDKIDPYSPLLGYTFKILFDMEHVYVISPTPWILRRLSLYML